MALASKTCIPCRGGVSPLARTAAEALLAETPGWALDEAASTITRSFRFPDFASALALVDRIGGLAEAEGHHPDIAFGWGYCRVSFQTHKFKGLHENDYIMEDKVNALAETP